MEKAIKRAARAASGLSVLMALALIWAGCPTDDGGGKNGNNNPIVPEAEAGDLKTETLNGVAVNFRYVPVGSFQRDSTAANVSVISNGYWLAETETTQELFQQGYCIYL